jgi:hypothetical protein
MRLPVATVLLAIFLFAAPAKADETGNPAVIVNAYSGDTFYAYGKRLAALPTKYLGCTLFAASAG